MFERFAEEARRATALASGEAREMGHDFIGTEHLLLGLLASGEGMAYSVLTDLEVTLDDARRKVTERVHAYGSGSIDSPPFTPLAKKSLERALREALQLSATRIGSEHLLLGLIGVPDGGGARIVVELAGNLDQVRQTVLTRIGPRPTSTRPLEQTKAPVTPKTLRRWAAQGLTVLRPPAGPVESPRTRGSDRPVGPPPRCPSCQASLATQARYRQISVPPGPDTERPAATDTPDPALADLGTPDPVQAEPPDRVATDPLNPAAPDTAAANPDDHPDPAGDHPDLSGGEAVVVTLVYCGRCGAALGVA